MTDDLIHLTASGVSLLLDVSGGRLPRVVHWGAALGTVGADDLDQDSLAAIARATVDPRVGGELDERNALSVLPEQSWGWMHTPGIAGSRGGRDHSTRFDVVSIEHTNAGPVDSDGSGEDSVVQRVTVVAADAVAELSLEVTIEMLGSGLVRTRAALTSTGDGSGAVEGHDGEPYQVEQLTLLLPVPREATELLDYTGRWIRERAPQRHAFVTGTHVRESRRGKPGVASFLPITDQDRARRAGYESTLRVASTSRSICATSPSTESNFCSPRRCCTNRTFTACPYRSPSKSRTYASRRDESADS